MKKGSLRMVTGKRLRVPSADVIKTGKDDVLFTIHEHFRARQVKKLSRQIAVIGVVHH